MDLPRDGPDRPACVVMWYSAPVAEELCEDYKGVQHRDIAAIAGERWDCPTLETRWDKMLVPLHCRLGTHACQEQTGFQPFDRLLATPPMSSHDPSMLCAGTKSSTRMGSDRHQQPLSRTSGKRGERIGEAKQPGPATEAVITRKGKGSTRKKSLPHFANLAPPGSGPLTLPQEALERIAPPQAEHCKHGFTLMEGNSLTKAWKLYMLSKKLGQLNSQDLPPPQDPQGEG